ncbi:c terminal region domain-containing protein, partial [Cystoisospora suis]
MQMRVPNQGHMGYRGGKPGHLFVVIHIKPHEIFKWVDDDIHVDVPLSIKQCLLGGKIDVPTVEGGRYSLFVPPGTNPSTVKILKGKGPPKIDHSKGHRHFGNLVLHFVL